MSPEPFTVSIADAQLDDLRSRLRNARWAEDFGNADWRYGVPREYLEDVRSYWLDEYDWRRVEQAMNGLPHYRVTIDGIVIHFVHRRSEVPAATPLVLTHGWPWTFWDLVPLIAPLADPEAHGAQASDAFDLVIPSLPGFAFSSPLRRVGVGAAETARLWRLLMTDVLGYERFGAQGNDFGAIVTQRLAESRSADLIGVHLSRYRRPTPAGGVDPGAVKRTDFAASEEAAWARHEAGLRLGASHLAVHTHDPQTLAHALNDSPMGLAAWLLERRRNWSGCRDRPEEVFSREDLITNVMLYWLTGTIGTSTRLYWETAREQVASPQRGRLIEAPVAVAVLPEDVIAMPRHHAEEDTNLTRWTEFTRGGHFGPAEVPELYVEDLRSFFKSLRDREAARR